LQNIAEDDDDDDVDDDDVGGLLLLCSCPKARLGLLLKMTSAITQIFPVVIFSFTAFIAFMREFS